MSGIYKTPGVYVEEIPKFPPSIAPVETAIPAFIGYTEKAIKNGTTLYRIPTAIESITEFEFYFGGAPPQKIETYIDSSGAFIGAKKLNGLVMYDCLRLFYANGGGKCYIVSIGKFTDTLDKQDFLDGIGDIRNEDEPTMLLFPDAVNLSGTTDLYDIQIEALKQCGQLMDRVVICDLKNDIDFNDMVKEFRDKIGINNLKYGAAYGPWINSSLTRFLSHRDLTLKRDNSSGLAVDLKNLTTDAKILQVIFDVGKAEESIDALNNAETLAAGAGKNWEDMLKTKTDLYDSQPNTETLVNLEGELQGIYNLLAKIVAEVQIMTTTLPAVVSNPNPGLNQTEEFNLKATIEQYILNSGIKAVFDSLAAHYNFLKVVANGNVSLFSDNPATATSNLGRAISLLGYSNAAAFQAVSDGTLSGTYGSLTDKPRANVAKNAAVKAMPSIVALYQFAKASATEYEKKFNDALLSGFGYYKNIVSKSIEILNLLPPSGAIAGVYASVDRERGVWKAPANVSLNAVIGPAVKISHEQQAEYNVDVNAGKSINIIRSFTGKGTLVWGARTLAGNDNEWRYISVRRFFNFVEESVKKATEQFVFEPNDANTWVRVQAMIENFLNTLWRQGALQGIKPEHAFYVAVGLGKTMTPLDILEGRMIIEIGMAAVRPAEFIILRFSHKMAES